MNSIFSSERERRLWLWTLAAVAAIFATLGLAQTLAGILRDRGLLTGVFWLGFWLIGAAVFFLGLKTRPRGIEISIWLGIAGVYLMTMLRMAIPEERSHLMEYSVVAVLIHEALKERALTRRVPVPALLAIGMTALVGVFDETIQLLLPNRVFDPIDMLFNALAAFMAISASQALAWARRRARRLAPQDLQDDHPE